MSSIMEKKHLSCSRHLYTSMKELQKIKIYHSKYYGWVDADNNAIKRECSRCGEVKLMDEFSPHSDKTKGFGGKRSGCKKCNNKQCKTNDARRAYNTPEYKLWQGAKERSKRRGLKCDLTLQDIKDIYPKDNMCPVFGIEMKQGKGRVCPTSPTLDRIDSSKGYEKDNIVVISHRANTLKSSGTLEEHLLLCEWLAKVTPK